MANSLHIQFILPAICAVCNACMSSSRNCHGLLKGKKKQKKSLKFSFTITLQRRGGIRPNLRAVPRSYNTAFITHSSYNAPATPSTTTARTRRGGEGGVRNTIVSFTSTLGDFSLTEKPLRSPLWEQAGRSMY